MTHEQFLMAETIKIYRTRANIDCAPFGGMVECSVSRAILTFVPLSMEKMQTFLQSSTDDTQALSSERPV